MRHLFAFIRASFCLSAITMVAVANLSAEVEEFALEGDYADFAMNPSTGDIVALDAEKGQAHLFRIKGLEMSSEPAETLRVGSTPVSIFFKEFDKKQVFAVVCSQDSHMYLIDASDFKLRAKVELNQSGVTHVTGSRNSKDPFVYYNYGGGHGSAAGVVSLRDMKNKGVAFDDSMDCAISANGEVAYRRGPWSPSGFESLIRTSEPNADKPVFARLFYDHNSTAQYVPDPFDRFTAAGTKIYTRSLDKSVATLEFFPLEFFKDRPVVVGVAAVGRFPSSHPADGPITLRAASYNTFSDIGDSVKLTPKGAKDEGSLPRGVGGHADFKRVSKRMRLFADEARDRVVYANRNQLFIVPLAEFNLPKEPFLLAEIKGSDQIMVGKESKLVLVPRDENVEVEFDDIPEGMKRSGMNITWTPELDAVGPVTLAVTLKHADIQRSMKFDLNVKYPSVKLPFAPANMVITSDEIQAIIWEGQRYDQYGRPTGGNVPDTNRIAVIDIASGEITAERKLASAIGKGVATGTNIYLWTPNASPKCEVLKLKDLQRAKTLVTAAPIRQLDVVGESLIVQTTNGVEVYDNSTFATIGKITTGSTNGTIYRREGIPGVLNSHGIYLKNNLYDLQLKPKLLLTASGLPVLAGADTRFQPSFLAMSNANPQSSLSMSRMRSSGEQVTATAKIPDSRADVFVVESLQQIQVSGATHTSRTKAELKVRANGDFTGQQVLSRKNLYAQTSASQSTGALIDIIGKRVFVVAGNELYQWDLPGKVGGEAATTARLALVPQQSAFTLAASGKTVLKHEVTGGKAPVKFTLLSPYDGLNIDEKTGTLDVDNAVMLKETLASLENFIVRTNRGEAYVDTLRNQAVRMIENATPLLGRRPEGAPVAVPIRVEASAADLATASLQYYLIAEVPSKLIMDRLKERDDKRAKQLAQAKAMKPVEKPDDVGPRANDASELARRVESLENRVDLLTRQLNVLLKKLDKE